MLGFGPIGSAPIGATPADMSNLFNQAVTAAGVDQSQLSALIATAERVRTGEVDTVTASAELDSTNSAFANLLRAANGSAALLTLLVTIASLYLAFLAIEHADAGSAVAHEDAERAHYDAQAQLNAVNRLSEQLKYMRLDKDARAGDKPRSDSRTSEQSIDGNTGSEPII